jgi:hypothetical protein
MVKSNAFGKTIGDKLLMHYRYTKTLFSIPWNKPESVGCDKFVFYDTAIVEGDIWKEDVYHKRIQSQGDLGHKMQAAFELLLTWDTINCIIVGSDLFDLKSELIETALRSYTKNEVVLRSVVKMAEAAHEKRKYKDTGQLSCHGRVYELVKTPNLPI